MKTTLPSHIKGILLDYGGTIDTNGIHWSEVIFQAYAETGIAVAKADFREAYVHAERRLEKEAHIVNPNYTFKDVMLLKTDFQLQYLEEQGNFKTQPRYREQIANYCYRFAKDTVAAQIPTLQTLAANYRLALVSNFYGNLSTVLRDFNLTPYFETLVESSAFGIRKPDPELFHIAIKALHLHPDECIVVGDSYTNDILPAKQIGCTAVWLKGIGWDAESPSSSHTMPDYLIGSLSDLPLFLANT